MSERFVSNESAIDQATLEKPAKIFYQFLIVDDDRLARKILRSMLESDGYTEIDEAGTGGDAIDVLSEKEYHLILLDKHMPEIDGIEVLKFAKTVQPGAEVIMVTSYGSLETAVQAMEMGAYSYLTKPFSDVDLVMKRVEGALERVTVRHQSTLLLGRLEIILEQLEEAEAHQDQQLLVQRFGDVKDQLRRVIEDLRSLL